MPEIYRYAETGRGLATDAMLEIAKEVEKRIEWNMPADHSIGDVIVRIEISEPGVVSEESMSPTPYYSTSLSTFYTFKQYIRRRTEAELNKQFESIYLCPAFGDEDFDFYQLLIEICFFPNKQTSVNSKSMLDKIASNIREKYD